MSVEQLERQTFQAHAKVDEILSFIKENSNTMEAHQMEEYIQHQVQIIGKGLMTSYFLSVENNDVGAELVDEDGNVYKRHNVNTKVYHSVFGKIDVQRRTYRCEGQSCIIPLDIQCNLPDRSYSYFLQDIMDSLSVNGTFNDSKEKVKKFFNLSIHERQFEDVTKDNSAFYDEFYGQKSCPETQTEGQLQMMEFDGKGVPLIKKDAAEIKARQGKGEKRQKKKEALVGVSYTVDERIRTPEQVAKNLVYPSQPSSDKSDVQLQVDSPEDKVPKAQNILRLASLKKTKLEVIQAMQRDCLARNKDKHRPVGVLIDGMPYLYKLVKQGLDEVGAYVIILDIIHVMEYLYIAAHALHPEGSEQAKAYVYKQLLGILKGNVGRVVGSMKQSVAKQNLSKSKTNAMEKVIKYLSNHKDMMKYDQYMEAGFPIATGIVESSCKSVVKKRMEGCGTKWSLDGAEAMLLLRSVHKSHDWNEYYKFKIQEQKKRRDNKPYYARNPNKIAA